MDDTAPWVPPGTFCGGENAGAASFPDKGTRLVATWSVEAVLAGETGLMDFVD